MKTWEKIKKILIVGISLCLFLIVGFIVYCKVQEQIYYRKGPKYVPEFSVYTISSGSMSPNYNKYDLVINRRIDTEDIKEGDVITFFATTRSFMGVVTHRVVGFTEDEKGRKAFITKGDNNDVEDDDFARAHNVIGRVVVRIPFIGFLGTPYGIFFFVIIVLASAILKKVKKSEELEVR